MKSNCYSKFFFLCCFLTIAGSGFTQKLRLNGYASYALDGVYHIYYENGDYYNGTINKGLQLGLGTEYLLSPRYGAEVSWLTRSTHVFPEGGTRSETRNTRLNFNYLLLGLNAYPQSRSRKLEAFGGVSAGILIQSIANTNNITDNVINHSITKFAWGAKLGGIFWMCSGVGIKLQTQWLSSLQFKNGTVNFDVHRSVPGNVNNSIANQFEVGSGLVVKLEKLCGKK